MIASRRLRRIDQKPLSTLPFHPHTRPTRPSWQRNLIQFRNRFHLCFLLWLRDLRVLWTNLDPQGAKEAFALASPALVEDCHRSFCLNLAKDDPEGTLEFMKIRKWVTPPLHGQLDNSQNKIYEIWASTDPEAAVHHAGSDQMNLRACYLGWAKRDPKAVLEVISQIQKKFDRDDCLEVIARYVLPNDPFLELDDLRANSVTSLWARDDFDGFHKFAESLPADSPWRKAFFKEVAEKMATADPEAAIELFQEAGGAETSDYTNSGIFRQAFISLNASDPERAKELLLEIPEQHRHIGLEGILTNEFAVDPVSAILQARDLLEDGETREYVLPALKGPCPMGTGVAIKTYQKSSLKFLSSVPW